MPITRAKARARALITDHNRARPLLKLPDEVLLRVYLQIGSIDAVWALMCTSRQLWSVFHTSPVQIIQTVLTNDMPDQLAGPIQAAWNLRSGSLSSMPLHHMRSIDEGNYLSLLNRDVSDEFVHNFMALARKIHGMAHEILNDCLTNLNNIRHKLYPFPMLFPELQKIRPYEYDRVREVDPTPFLKGPSWEEELRMIQGLWLCEFHSSLMKAQQDGDPWVCAQLQSLAPATELRLENFFINGWAGTLWTIYHGLTVMERPPDEIDTPYGEATVLPDTMPLTTPLRPGGLQKAQDCWGAFKIPPPAPGEEEAWEQTVRDMNPETEGYKFLIAEDDGFAPVVSGLYRLPACEYVHLGLLHWCSGRMHHLGLTYKDDHRIAKMWYGRVYDYWLNLLPAWLIKRWETIQAPEKLEQRMREQGGA